MLEHVGVLARVGQVEVEIFGAFRGVDVRLVGEIAAGVSGEKRHAGCRWADLSRPVRFPPQVCASTGA